MPTQNQPIYTQTKQKPKIWKVKFTIPTKKMQPLKLPVFLQDNPNQEPPKRTSTLNTMVMTIEHLKSRAQKPLNYLKSRVEPD